jgi:hypothetical protein
MPRITKPELIRGCQRVIELATQYKPKDHHREMGYDGLLFGFLDAKFGGMKRQHKIWIGKSRSPKRLDYRQGGTRPVVIEFVVRTPGRNEIYGSQNGSEIGKLTRQRKASTRYLVLFDLSEEAPMDTKDLWQSYRKLNGGRGKFKRKPVQIIYVHPGFVDSYLWKPLKKKK